MQNSPQGRGTERSCRPQVEWHMWLSPLLCIAAGTYPVHGWPSTSTTQVVPISAGPRTIGEVWVRPADCVNNSWSFDCSWLLAVRLLSSVNVQPVLVPTPQGTTIPGCGLSRQIRVQTSA